MGILPSKCKIQDSKQHIYYAAKLKKRNEVSIFDSDILKSNSNKNDDSNMYLTFDVDEMKLDNNEGTKSKSERENIIDSDSSFKLKEVVQFWANCSRENISDSRRTIPNTPLLMKGEQNKHSKMIPSKGLLAWTNNEEGSKKSVKSTAAQAGSFANLRGNSIFKGRVNKGSNSSSSSLNQKDCFSDSKSRSQSESFDSSGKKSKHSLRNFNQIDSALEAKSKYSSDNLSDSVSRTRDLDMRTKGAGINESRLGNRMLENVESRSRKKEHDPEQALFDNVISDVDDENITNNYIDARWQALCSSNEKDQILVPCPTCGRKFSEEAAYRHFPICSRVKEKNCSVKSSKNHMKSSCRSPSSPSFINVMADDPVVINEKKEDFRKQCKPIVFTFNKGGLKTPIKSLEVKKSIKSAEHCKNTFASSAKNSLNNNFTVNPSKSIASNGAHKSDFKYRKRRGSVPRSDGVRKSAFIWRKSTKEFKTLDTGSTKPNNKRKESNSSAGDESSNSSRVDFIVKVPSSRESRGNGAASESRLCPTCGRLSNSMTEKDRAIEQRTKSKPGKMFNSKNKITTNKANKGNAKEISNMQDLDIIPQNLRKKDNIGNANKCSNTGNCFDSLQEKCDPCLFCGNLIRSNLMDNHTHLCERIHNIEVIISKSSVNTDGPTTDICVYPPNFKKQIADEVSPINKIKVDPATSRDYRLYKQGCESVSGTNLRTVVSIKCPCCSQLLDLRHD